MLALRCFIAIFTGRPEPTKLLEKYIGTTIVCAAKDPRSRCPRVWKSKRRIGTISKSLKLVESIKGLSNVKEEVYGSLDAFVAWELEFPLVTVKKALKILEREKEWKRIIQMTKWMLSKGQGRTMGSYYSLMNALAEDGRLEEAEELWNKLLSENLESLPRIFFEKMISIYYQNKMHGQMFEVFADMEELNVRPSVSIVKMVGDVFEELNMLDKYRKLKNKYPPQKWKYRYIRGKRMKIRVKDTSNYGDPEAMESDTEGYSELDEKLDENTEVCADILDEIDLNQLD